MTDLAGDEDVAIEATLNGKPLKRRVKARQHLADFLRQELELTGTHLGCEHGICGACTVMIDGRTARGCLTLAAQISGKTVDTIEGLTENGNARRAAGRVHRAQRRTMRVLLVRHAADGLRAGVERRDGVARPNSRIHLRQHVPLHRLSRHRRCRGSRDCAAGKDLMHANAASATGIGARIPRRELKRLLSGHGRYIDDIKLPRMLHACFVRSPHPHAKVVSIEVAAAKDAPGVAAVFTAADINPKCEPFVGVALHRPGHRSAPQHLLAAERAVWQGQPVAIVVAESRAEAEDAAELVAIEWQPLPAVGDQLQAIAPGAPVIHAELGDNVAFDFSLEKGQPNKAFADADIVIEEELRFERQMAMTLETRGLIADFNPGDGSLTVIHAHQSPFQMQEIFSRHLKIPEHKIRVTAPDIGGGFGMKLNTLFRRDCDRGGEHAARPAGQVLRRPAGVVRLRRAGARPSHQMPHRAEARPARFWPWRWTTSPRSAPTACRFASTSPKA